MWCCILLQMKNVPGLTRTALASLENIWQTQSSLNITPHQDVSGQSCCISLSSPPATNAYSCFDSDTGSVSEESLWVRNVWCRQNSTLWHGWFRVLGSLTAAFHHWTLCTLYTSPLCTIIQYICFTLSKVNLNLNNIEPLWGEMYALPICPFHVGKCRETV